jgi:uncharacterized membrane protein required for colicin V production
MGFLPAWLNPFDVLIVLGLLIGVILGFTRGLVRMAMSLLVLYVAAVLAMTFYGYLGSWIRYLFGMPLSICQGAGFLLILVLVSAIINFVLRRTYKDTELPGVRQVDQLGGMAIGFFVTSFWIGFSILVLAYFLGAPGVESRFHTNMLAYFRTSGLIPVFYKFLPIALASLRPWMPKGLPPGIFTFRL